MITIKINHDYRRFKEGEEFNLDVSPSHVLFLTGNNRTGKSSILRGIRGIKDTLEKVNKDCWDGMRSSVNEVAALEFQANASIEGLDQFDEVFCLDRVTDDPTSFEAAATASGLIGGGGWYTQKASGGEKSLIMMDMFAKKIAKYHKQGNRALIILDEVDNGFDINLQQRFAKGTKNILDKAIKEEYSLLIVTHSPLAILSKFNEALKYKIYDMNLRYTFDSAEMWFYLNTGMKISYNETD